MLFEDVEPIVPSSALVIDPRAQQRQLIRPQSTLASGALPSLLAQAAPP
jgi:hypothetical protein